MGNKAGDENTVSLSRALCLNQAMKGFGAAHFRSRNNHRNDYDLPVVLSRSKSPSEAAL